mmetsp:Transcript_86822/g.202059  ORF Transcript_86822/g.202059 Transcript_86822/m.202059 type:complete len:462 (+) Transcript_86822:161-1546(+)
MTSFSAYASNSMVVIAYFFLRSMPSTAQEAPLIIPLRREVDPVRHEGKLVSFKTSYSGLMHVGNPPKEFRVVFDTGSGHVVVPSSKCIDPACVKKKTYDLEESITGQHTNINGMPVFPGNKGDEISIGYGKGEVRGELARDKICLGAAPDEEEGEEVNNEHCVYAGLVMANNMSSDPFENFTFDAIFGLGLESLAVSGQFSFLRNLARQQGDGGLGSFHFGVFLAEGDDEEESEIAFGGHNPAHLLEPLTWVPLAKPELGYWMVEVLGIFVDDRRLDICNTGNCTGILDTGTSHLGLPPNDVGTVSDLLVRPAGSISDCRQIAAPVVKIELQGYNLTMLPENYMRRLPLPAELLSGNSSLVLDNSSAAGTREARSPEMECTPKLMSINLPMLGPNAFLLGEPALHRYYTAYDAQSWRAGFGLAARRKRAPTPEEQNAVITDEILLMQMQGNRLPIMKKVKK